MIKKNVIWGVIIQCWPHCDESESPNDLEKRGKRKSFVLTFFFWQFCTRYYVSSNVYDMRRGRIFLTTGHLRQILLYPGHRHRVVGVV